MSRSQCVSGRQVTVSGASKRSRVKLIRCIRVQVRHGSGACNATGDLHKKF